MIYYCTYLFYHHIVASFCFISVDEGPGDQGPGDWGAGVSSSSSSSSSGLDTPVPMDTAQPSDGESLVSE
jgi:hypothetical protein